MNKIKLIGKLNKLNTFEEFKPVFLKCIEDSQCIFEGELNEKVINGFLTCENPQILQRTCQAIEHFLHQGRYFLELEFLTDRIENE